MFKVNDRTVRVSPKIFRGRASRIFVKHRLFPFQQRPTIKDIVTDKDDREMDRFGREQFSGCFSGCERRPIFIDVRSTNRDASRLDVS